MVVLPCNNPPVVDTIVAGTTIKVPVSPTDTTLIHSTAAPDTFTVRVAAHEMDTAIGDAIISYLWEYLDGNLNNATSTSNTFTYMSADTTYIDTVSLTIKDKYNAENRHKIIITFTK